MAIIKIPEFNRIYINNHCQSEIESITKGYGHKKDFQTWLLNCLEELNDSQNDYIAAYPKKFEHLTSELYGITYRHAEKNIRIIFTVSDDDVIRLLLCCFDEKKTQANYKRFLQLAAKRREELYDL